MTKHWTKVRLDGNQYLVDSYRGKRSFTEAPDYSVLPLYSNPLNRRSKIFYEAESDFIPLKYREDDTVELKAPDGSKTIYHFSHGTISDIEVPISNATVHMQRIK